MKLELFEKIRQDHFRLGLSIRHLSRKYQTHRRMVRQAIASSIPPSRKSIARKCPKLDAVRGFIDKILESDLKSPKKQRHTARRIWVRINEEMPESALSEATVRNYVREQKIKLGLSFKEVFVPQSYDLGYAAQVDWYEAVSNVGDERVKHYYFCMRSMGSGGAFHCAYSHANQQSFLEAHEKAFKYFGGVFTVIRYDNLKSAVKKVLRGYKREQADRFIAFRSHWGFEAEFCNVRRGNEKGGVEGECGFFRRNHLVPIPSVENIESLNEILLKACESDEKRMIGDRTKTVGELLIDERKCLLPLPKEGFDLSEDIFCRVNKQRCVIVRTNSYSVPAKPGSEVLVKVYADRVAIMQSGKLLTEHERSYSRKQSILNLEHYLDALERKPGAMASSTPLQQWRKQGRWPKEYDIIWQMFIARKGKNPATLEMIELLQLAKKHGYNRLTEAIKVAIDEGCSDSAAIKHLMLSENKKEPEVLALDDLINLQQYERSTPSIIEYDLLMRGVH